MKRLVSLMLFVGIAQVEASSSIESVDEAQDHGALTLVAPVVGVPPQVQALELTDMPAIHRGFVRDDATHYTFHVMAQGATKKNCYGVASLSNAIQNIELIKIFAMPKEDKRVGRTSFTNLDHSTAYELKIGFVKGTRPTSIGSWDNLLTATDLTINWGNLPIRMITTPPQTLATSCSLLFGSCNRFFNIIGHSSMLENGSTIFQSMADDIAQQSLSGLRTDAVVTLGDWIYTDPLAFGIGEKTTFKDIMKLYHLTNTTSGAKALFESGPPVMQVWDDHERYNDSTGEVPPHKQGQADAGKRAYDLYQRPQGPFTPNNWYQIDGNVDGFVMDLRSELLPSQHQAVSPAQMTALKTYLSDPVRKDRLKPIFMSTTALCLQGDAWSASPKQLRSLMKYIKANKIKGVVILTGDIHVGVSGLWGYNNSTKKKPYVLEVASSAFHKISHSKSGLLKANADLSIPTKQGPYMSAEGGLSHITTEDHYTRVTFDHQAMTVRVMRRDRDNILLEDVVYDLKNGNFMDSNTAPLYKRMG